MKSHTCLDTHQNDDDDSDGAYVADRLLFWTSVGRYQKIESSSLDGTRRTLVSRGVLPVTLSSLAVDPQSHRVFWSNAARQCLETATYNGSAWHITVSEGVKEPGAVAVVGQHVYWLDEGAQTVERAGKETSRDRVVVKRRLSQLTDLLAVVRPNSSSSHDKCVSVDACGRLNCSHLCVVNPDGTEHCSCPVGMSLDHDSATCVPDCSSDHVRCGNGECVLRCDGVVNCRDGRDELGCHVGSCEFQCLVGARRCVSAAACCDGLANCDDASDEQRCTRCVGSGVLLCHADARCIESELFCDGHPHCSDGEDELHCAPAASTSGRSVYTLVVVVCGLLLIVIIALTVMFWRCYVGKSVISRRTATVTSKPRLQAMLAAVSSSTSYRDGSSLVYDRVSPTSSSSTITLSSTVSYRCYPLNPPPSPCTGTSSQCCSSHLMTPCSTDDIDSASAAAAALSGWDESLPLYTNRPPIRGGCNRQLGWWHDDTGMSVTTCSHDVDCVCRQHNVTRVTSPLSSLSSHDHSLTP